MGGGADSARDTGSPNLNQLVGDIQPRIQSAIGRGGASPNLKIESSANARAAAHELALKSKLLSEALASGKLSIQVAIYDLETGKVEFDKK